MQRPIRQRVASTMNDRFDLDRFVAAQSDAYPQALAELRAGHKASHWMWYVFPQIAGLGHSAMARRYAISSLPEARAYLMHPVLGRRLVESTVAVLGWSGRRSAETILGGIDAVKFRSSMTLFEAAGCEATEREAAAYTDVASTGSLPFAAAIDAFHGGVRDPETLARLGT